MVRAILAIALVVAAATEAYCSPILPGVAAYEGEYVVTLKPQTPTRGVVGSLTTTATLSEQVTVVEQLGNSVIVLSEAKFSRASANRRTAQTKSLISDEEKFCKRLLANKLVDSCTPNYQLSISQATGSDPLLSFLWGMTDERGIAATSAWATTTGSPQVVVAVIDTGIDYTHPDLAANIWSNPGEVAGNGVDDDGNGYVDDIRGINFSVGAPSVVNPMDDNKHGTHVAGTIGALHGNGIGVRGVAGAVKLLPIKFMDSNGSGRLSDAIAAINYMVDLKVNRGVNIRVANNSWGGGGYSAALEAAIRRAHDAGIVFVVAAGNSGSDIDLFPTYPAGYDVENIVSVAATDRDQNLAVFSNYGAVGVDIAAPGSDITSTVPGGNYESLSGTSMATPHVAGSLALLFSIAPAVAVTDAITRLMETGRELPSLASPEGDLSYVRSRRLVNAPRLLANTREPLTDPNANLSPCGYQLQAANIVESGSLDNAADRLNPINQVDEGDFKAISLPFDFPFFRTKTRVLYVSPNGVVYLNLPRGTDYQVAARAPNNSIAAFHSDLTPRNAKQGVRAYVGADRVVLYWLSEHYALTDRGPIAVRLTLYRSGLIRSTVSFEAARDPLGLSWLVLGNGFSPEFNPPLGLIGASATSAANSSTVDIAAAQRGLVSGPNSRLDLSVTMVPTCFDSSINGPPEDQLQLARVRAIKMRFTNNNKIAVQLAGVGTGKIPLRAAINGRTCSQVAWGSMRDGRAAFKLSRPAQAYKVALQSVDTKTSIRSGSVRSMRRREKHLSMCAQFLQGVR